MLLNGWLRKKRGRAAGLARHLNIPASMVARMATGKKRVPLEHCPAIQVFTGHEVTCEELRPDARDYFTQIRDLPSVAHGEAPVADRRSVARASPYAGTDIDRRAPGSATAANQSIQKAA